MERVIFEVPGKPQGKGRPRASVVGGHARMYTPAGTASYENKIMLCYQQRHAGVRFVPPIILEVNAYFAIPKSYPKKKAALCSQNTPLLEQQQRTGRICSLHTIFVMHKKVIR